MIEESPDHIEQVAAELVQYGWIRREEIFTQLGIGEDVLDVCLQWQIIDMPQMSSDGHLIFSSDTVDRLCRGIRLNRDLGLNWPGVSVVMDLLDRIDELEGRLQELSGTELMDLEKENE